jgi:hypothetical protein
MRDHANHPSFAYGTECFHVDGVHFYKYRGFYLNFEKFTPLISKSFYEEVLSHIKYAPALLTFINHSSHNKKCHCFWGVIGRQDAINLASLTPKARYEIKAGEKKYLIKKMPPDTPVEEIINIYKSSFKKYGEKINESQLSNYLDTLKFSANNPEILHAWGCYESNNLVGIATIGVDTLSKTFDLKNIKINYSISKTGLSNYFIFSLVNYYLESNPKGFFTTGTTSISHNTSFQDFLIKKLNFSIYCAKPVILVKKPLRHILILCQFALRKLGFCLPSRKIKLFLNCIILN